MARDYKQIKADVWKRLRKMRLAGDFKGMAEYYHDIVERDSLMIEHDKENYANSEYKKEQDAANEYMESLTSHGIEDDRFTAFIEIQKELAKKRVHEGIKLNGGYDKIQKRIENDEIEGVELIRNDPKTVKKFTKALSLEKRNASKLKAYELSCRNLISIHSNLEDAPPVDLDATLREAGKNAFIEAGIPEDKINEYDIPEIVPGEMKKIGEGFSFDYGHFDSSKPISKAPEYFTKIKQTDSIEELDAYRKEIEKDKENILVYENAAREMGSESKKLLAELKTYAKEPASEAYQELYDSLENMGNIGGVYRSVNVQDKKLDESTETIIRHNKMSNLLDLLSLNGEDYAKENPEFGEKIKSFAEKQTKHLDDVHKEYVSPVEHKPDYNLEDFVHSGTCDKIIKLVDKEKHLRELKQAYPEETAEIAAKHKECTERNKKIDDLDDYIRSAQRANDMLAQPMKIMAADRKKHGKGSASYENFTDRLREFSEMDPAKTTPSEYITKLQHLQSAAKVYEAQHTGASHMFSGWTDDAKERIDCARRVQTIASLKLKELAPKFNKIIDETNKIPGEVVETLEAQNDAVREECRTKEKALDDRLAFDKSKEAFADIAAKTYLQNKYKADLDKYFAEHPDFTEQQRQSVIDNTASVEDYVKETLPQMKNNEQFKRFMDGITDQQTLDQYKAMAQQNGGAELYGAINQAAQPQKQAEEIAPEQPQQEAPKFSPDAKIKEIQDMLGQAKERNGKVPNKNDARLEYAMIAAAHLVKVQQKNNQMLDMDEESFEAYATVLADSAPFKAVIKKYTNQVVYEKATDDKGQNLFTSYTTAQKQYQEYEKIKNGANRTVDKNQELEKPKTLNNMN